MEEDLPEVTIDSLRADKDLQAELRALGWVDDHAVEFAPRGSKNQAAYQPGEDLVDFDLNSMANLGIIDENAIQFDEKDLEDPELLSMYQAMSVNPQQESYFTPPQSRQEHVQAPREVIPTINPKQVTEVTQDILNYSTLTAEEAKQKALQFKREGNTEEALKWFRLSKQLQSAKEEQSSAPAKGPLPPPKPEKPMKPAKSATEPSRSSRASPAVPVPPPPSSSTKLTAKSVLEKG